ncbi:MAG: 50S ribosomal protein L10 [Planctomycetota bacterium]
MPNVVVKHAFAEYGQDIEGMGSCLIVSFDKLTVKQSAELRNQFRDRGVRLKVVRNRILKRALGEAGFEVTAVTGKCGVAFAPEEKAIEAAKLVRDFAKAHKGLALDVLGGIVEGEVIEGPRAGGIADMPDKNTVRSMLLSAIQGPARGLAVALSGLPAGLARCLKQRSEQD